MYNLRNIPAHQEFANLESTPAGVALPKDLLESNRGIQPQKNENKIKEQKKPKDFFKITEKLLSSEQCDLPPGQRTPEGVEKDKVVEVSRPQDIICHSHFLLSKDHIFFNKRRLTGKTIFHCLTLQTIFLVSILFQLDL